MGKLQTRFIILGFLMVGAWVAVQAAQRISRAEIRRPSWGAIPYQLGSWTGTDVSFDQLLAADPADATLLRVYRRGDGPPVIVYTGYHENVPKTLEDHEPEQCYPAQGWTIGSHASCRIGRFRGEWVSAKEIQVNKDGNRRLVVWWFHVGPKPFQNRIRQVYRLMFTSMFTGRMDGTIVRIETEITNEAEQSARERILDLSNSLLPSMELALAR